MLTWKRRTVADLSRLRSGSSHKFFTKLFHCPDLASLLPVANLQDEAGSLLESDLPSMGDAASGGDGGAPSQGTTPAAVVQGKNVMSFKFLGINAWLTTLQASGLPTFDHVRIV